MTETETVYKKVGRKYVPLAVRWYEDARMDQIPVGTFRLLYAYSDGGRRYEYDVTPASAPMVAAMTIARAAMEEAIRDACKMRPSTPQSYTKKQQTLITKFRADMGEKSVTNLLAGIEESKQVPFERVLYALGESTASKDDNEKKEYEAQILIKGAMI